MDDFDYLIVGGGTTGCILASRLTESGRHRVLLVETGGEPRSPFIRLPAGFGHLLRSRRYNWGYESEPDPDTDGRAIPLPSGRGLGGSGLINGMVYARGQPADYDGWAAAGATGWAHADVEPYFRRIENYAQDGQGRGRDGPLHVTQVRERFPVADAFLRAAVEDGGRLVEDYNLDQDGFGYYQVNQLRGRRWSPYDAYLAPARGRPNLSVMTHTHALGLHIRRPPMHRREDQARTVRASRPGPARGDPRRRDDPLTPAPRALRDRTRGRPELHRRAGAPRARGRRRELLTTTTPCA